MDADRSRIFHPSAGYRKYRLRAADGWQLVIRRLRRQLEVAQKELKRRSRSDTPALVEKAHAWAALPEHATAEKAKLAFDMVRKPRAAAVLTHIREHDRANGRRVSTMSAEAPAMMGRIGAANVLAVDDGAVPAACEACMTSLSVSGRSYGVQRAAHGDCERRFLSERSGVWCAA